MLAHLLSYILVSHCSFIFIGLKSDKDGNLFISLMAFEFFFLFRTTPRLGVESEVQLPAYATARAKRAPSHIFFLYHSSQQHRILNPLNKTTDQTCNFMIPSQIRFCCTTMGTPKKIFFGNVAFQTHFCPLSCLFDTGLYPYIF